MLTWPVAVVGWITSIVQQAEASQKRINNFLNEVPEINDGKIRINDLNGDIQFKNVSLFYPETKIKSIDNLSIKIKAGSTLGVIGKIGSGKSSFLELISSLTIL